MKKADFLRPIGAGLFIYLRWIPMTANFMNNLRVLNPYRMALR